MLTDVQIFLLAKSYNKVLAENLFTS